MGRRRIVAASPQVPPRAARNGPRGVVLLALLIALVLAGIALMAAVDVWALSRQRAREQELLFVGDQYRRAIQRYYFGAPPGTPRVLPTSLAALLEDDRYPMPVRHLRRLYPDPITGGGEWGVLRVGDGIAGVFSLSEREPARKAHFAPGYEQFEQAQAYRDWVFGVTPAGQPGVIKRPTTSLPAAVAPAADPQQPVVRISS